MWQCESIICPSNSAAMGTMTPNKGGHLRTSAVSARHRQFQRHSCVQYEGRVRQDESGHALSENLGHGSGMMSILIGMYSLDWIVPSSVLELLHHILLLCLLVQSLGAFGTSSSLQGFHDDIVNSMAISGLLEFLQLLGTFIMNMDACHAHWPCILRCTASQGRSHYWLHQPTAAILFLHLNGVALLCFPALCHLHSPLLAILWG